MRVCVLADTSFERNYSSYHLMRDLILYLLKSDDAVDLIQRCHATHGILPQELHGFPKLNLFEIDAPQAPKSSFIKRMIVDVRYFFQTIPFLRKCRDCDVFFLQSNNTPYIPIALIHIFTGKPVVYNVQDIFPQNALYAGMIKEKSIVLKVLLSLQKWSLMHADSIITVSEDMKDTLIKAGASIQKVSVVYNWDNETQEVRKSLPKDNDFHVVYAGNIGIMQNVTLILKAASMLKEKTHIHFDIYGDGAKRKECEFFAQHENLTDLSFFPPVPANQASELYYNADLNIVPLLDGVINTAMPSKTAVCVKSKKPTIFCVGKESKAAKILTQYKNCYVVSANDPSELATQIAILAEGKELNRATESSANNNITQNMFDKQSALCTYQTILKNTGNKR